MIGYYITAVSALHSLESVTHSAREQKASACWLEKGSRSQHDDIYSYSVVPYTILHKIHRNLIKSSQDVMRSRLCIRSVFVSIFFDKEASHSRLVPIFCKDP